MPNFGSWIHKRREIAVNANMEDVKKETLEQSPGMAPNILYDLFGTVNHKGTMNQGHYVSNVKVGETWYHCNDAHISFSEEADVLNSEGAYLLFYIRR